MSDSGASGGADPRPHSADDLRPRPQYGEYATPEEQRARIQQPDATWALETGQALEAPAYGESVPGAAASGGSSGASGVQTGPGSTPAPRYGATAGDAAPARSGSVVDRVITYALLGYGLVNVIFTAVSLFDFATVAATYMELVGIPGEFTNYAQGELWGPVAAVTMLVGWLVTALFALRRIRRGRRSWWVPIVGAAVTFIVSSIFLSVPLINDPAIAAYIASLS